MFNHVQALWIILFHWSGKEISAVESATVTFTVVQYERKYSSTKLHTGFIPLFCLYKRLKNIYPSSVFWGGKQWILHGFSPKTKVPGFMKKAGIVVPPRIHSRPPTRNLVWSYPEKRGDAWLPHGGRAAPYSCKDFRGKTRSSHTAKSQTQRTSLFGYEGLFDVCRGEKKTTKQRVMMHLWWCRESTPYVHRKTTLSTRSMQLKLYVILVMLAFYAEPREIFHSSCDDTMMRMMKSHKKNKLMNKMKQPTTLQLAQWF